MIQDYADVFQQIIIRAVISVALAAGLAVLLLCVATTIAVHLIRNHWIEVEEDEDTPTSIDYSEAA